MDKKNSSKKSKSIFSIFDKIKKVDDIDNKLQETKTQDASVVLINKEEMISKEDLFDIDKQIRENNEVLQFIQSHDKKRETRKKMQNFVNFDEPDNSLRNSASLDDLSKAPSLINIGEEKHILPNVFDGELQKAKDELKEEIKVSADEPLDTILDIEEKSNIKIKDAIDYETTFDDKSFDVNEKDKNEEVLDIKDDIDIKFDIEDINKENIGEDLYVLDSTSDVEEQSYFNFADKEDTKIDEDVYFIDEDNTQVQHQLDDVVPDAEDISLKYQDKKTEDEEISVEKSTPISLSIEENIDEKDENSYKSSIDERDIRESMDIIAKRGIVARNELSHILIDNNIKNNYDEYDDEEKKYDSSDIGFDKDETELTDEEKLRRIREKKKRRKERKKEKIKQYIEESKKYKELNAQEEINDVLKATSSDFNIDALLDDIASYKFDNSKYNMIFDVDYAAKIYTFDKKKSLEILKDAAIYSKNNQDYMIAYLAIKELCKQNDRKDFVETIKEIKIAKIRQKVEIEKFINTLHLEENYLV